MFDPKEEQKYNQLSKLAQELHVPMPQAFIELEVFDKDGKLIESHRQRSHSWTRNAWNMMFCGLGAMGRNDPVFGAGNLNYKDVDGVVKQGPPNYTIYGERGGDHTIGNGYRAVVTEDTKGIVIGTGVTAESFEDYVLDTPIDDGTGAGEMNFVEGELPTKDWVGGTLTFSAENIRYFNNNSGGSIGVNEIGLVLHESSEGCGMLVSRDKLGATVTVPDTGQLKVTYTIELTYPA